jgi:hypothetical protein
VFLQPMAWPSREYDVELFEVKPSGD